MAEIAKNTNIKKNIISLLISSQGRKNTIFPNLLVKYFSVPNSTIDPQTNQT
jgi:hypothetical protein